MTPSRRKFLRTAAGAVALPAVARRAFARAARLLRNAVSFAVALENANGSRQSACEGQELP
jgi:hypothetical protein